MPEAPLPGMGGGMMNPLGPQQPLIPLPLEAPGNTAEPPPADTTKGTTKGGAKHPPASKSTTPKPATKKGAAAPAPKKGGH